MGFFDVPADAYQRFMGRFSTPLSVPFADLALTGAPRPARVLDVGCGPGMLTAELARRVGEETVAAVDPAEMFVAAARQAHPLADVRLAPAEDLPFDDGVFDATAAQLVVQFMGDPSLGAAEMRRVTRPGGRVSACTWDHGSGRGPLSAFWGAARDLDPAVGDESGDLGVQQGQLVTLFEQAGLVEVTEHVLTIEVAMASFEEWWEPYTLGVGPAGRYVASMGADHRTALEQRLREVWGPAPFTVTASAWSSTGLA